MGDLKRRLKGRLKGRLKVEDLRLKVGYLKGAQRRA